MSTSVRSDTSALLGGDREPWREEVVAFLARHMTPELKAELRVTRGRHGGPEEERFRRAMIAEGFYGVSWPTEYGGMGRDAVDQMVLLDELDYHGAPSLPLTVTSLGPAVIQCGTGDNRRDLLPGITSGDITLALGYSEPEAGTDLASLRTTARLDGDEWVINGQKLWCSGAHYGTHFWMAVRTGALEDRHRGISVVVVPHDTPGITVREIRTWAHVRTNEVFLDDVRVPHSALVGEANKGWEVIRAALSYERLAIGLSGRARRLLDEVQAHCRDTMVDGRLLADDPVVANGLATLRIRVDAARLMNFRTANLMAAGREPVTEAATQKVWTTELLTELSAFGMEVAGLEGLLDGADPEAIARGELEWTFREVPLMRFGGGTNEVMRDIIAQTALGLPRNR